MRRTARAVSVSLLLAGLLMGLVGISLGLLGGGGSILAVPVLVYVARLPAPEAVAVSLVIVGTTSLGSAVLHARAGRVDGRTAALFGLAGMLAAPFGARLSDRVEPHVLLLTFALLMLVVGTAMLRPRSEGSEVQGRRHGLLAAAGAVVGALTGFLGVGGGFLIVPALVLLAGLPMPEAVGTSLAIITMNSLAALVAHREFLDGGFLSMAFLTLAALAGSGLGARWSGRWTPSGLRRSFAVLVLVVGGVMAAHNLLTLSESH